MAKLETEITVNVRDLPEVQQVLNECRELRDAAQEYVRTCPADPDTTPSFYAAHERLRAALAALTPSGVMASQAPSLLELAERCELWARQVSVQPDVRFGIRHAGAKLANDLRAALDAHGVSRPAGETFSRQTLMGESKPK